MTVDNGKRWNFMLTLWLCFLWGKTLRFQTVHNPLQRFDWLGDLMRQSKIKRSYERILVPVLTVRKMTSFTQYASESLKQIHYTSATTRCKTNKQKKDRWNTATNRKHVPTCSSSLCSLCSTAAELISSSLSSRSDMVVTLKNQRQQYECLFDDRTHSFQY